ncbi:PepSY domain-containing protein [Streptomyces buecherae]|uniref:PepSY domain-containing protein n=1 Tax=Streptomyces buecherae TaxID=2763006 RepID=UPI0033C6FCFA
MSRAYSPVPIPGRRPRPARLALTATCLTACVALLAGCGDDGGDGDGDQASPTASATKASQAPSGPSQPGGSPSASGRLTDDQAERRALLPLARVDHAKAAETAVAKVPGGRLVDLELRGTGGDRGDKGTDDAPGDKGTDDAPGDAGAADARAAGPSGTASPSGMASPRARRAEWIAKVATKDGTAHRVRVDAGSGEVLDAAAEADQDGDAKRELSAQLSKARRTPEQAARAATDAKRGTVTSVELGDDAAGALVWSVDVVTPRDWNKTTFAVDAVTGKVVGEHVDRD